MRTRKKARITDFLFHLFNYLIFGLFAFVCIYPFYYIFIYSLSSPQSVGGGMYLLPKGLTLSNYYYLMQNPGIAHAALISLARTLIGTASAVVCTALFGYIVTKHELPQRKLIYRFVVMTMYLNAGLIPVYMLYLNLGLINNFLVYIIPNLIGAFNMILVKTYIEQIPASVEESAMVDGAGYMRIFISLIFPLSMPIIATVIVFTAVFHWNSFSDNLIFVTDKNYETLQLILYRILVNVTEASQNVKTSSMSQSMQVFQAAPNSIRMTITMIATLPIVFVYPFLQRYFVKGIMLGAIKG